MSGIIGHRGMLLEAVSGGGDPSFAKVSLLLHMDGSNGSTTFTDSSVVGHAITSFGASTSTAQVKYGTASALFSNTRIGISDDASLNLTTGDWTAEAWVYPTSNSGGKAVLLRNDGGSGISQYFIDVSGISPRLFCWNTSSGLVASITSSVTSPINTWTHIAATRNGSTFTLWVGGISGGTATSSAALYLPSTPTALIGSYGGGTSPFAGYIDELRVTKGVARYTAPFTPPTAAFPNS